MKATTVAVDLTKNVFQIAVANSADGLRNGAFTLQVRTHQQGHLYAGQ